MALGDIIRKVHGDQNLSAMIDQFLLSPEYESYREPGWHPSEFCGMCPRAHVLSKLLKEKKEPFEAGLLRIFDVGSALHYWYQNFYFARMGILWGKWKCLRCDHIYWGKSPKKGCPTCGDKAIWDYQEVPVRASLPGGFENQIVGHSDGIILIGKLWYLLEIKSINDNGFTWQKKVKEAHEKQAQIYAELIRQGFVDFGGAEKIEIPRIHKILIFYVNKNNSKERQYLIDPDPSLARVELEKPHVVEVAIKNKELPSRREECVSMMRKPAKNCPMCSYCFGGKSWTQLEK